MDALEAMTDKVTRTVDRAMNMSWAANLALLVAKAIATGLSSSKAVTAALADSAVDIASQSILSISARYIKKHSPNYPVGRSRLEALSVLGCAAVMIMASVEVIQFSIMDLVNGFSGDIPDLNFGPPSYVILGVGTVLKLGLYLYCRSVGKLQKNDQLDALAEDHLNDVMSNTVAIVTAAIAFNTVAWYLDPIGAIIISVVIIYRWISIIMDQVKKIVGHTATPEFIEEVNKIAAEHDERLQVDCTRAYHFGSRYNVEMEIVLPGQMTVAESHDIALELQHKLEQLEDVERAFVHVDHAIRDGLEHKTERELHLDSLRSKQPEPPAAADVEQPSSPNDVRMGLRPRGMVRSSSADDLVHTAEVGPNGTSLNEMLGGD